MYLSRSTVNKPSAYVAIILIWSNLVCSIVHTSKIIQRKNYFSDKLNGFIHQEVQRNPTFKVTVFETPRSDTKYLNKLKTAIQKLNSYTPVKVLKWKEFPNYDPDHDLNYYAFKRKSTIPVMKLSTTSDMCIWLPNEVKWTEFKKIMYFFRIFEYSNRRCKYLHLTNRDNGFSNIANPLHDYTKYLAIFQYYTGELYKACWYCRDRKRITLIGAKDTNEDLFLEFNGNMKSFLLNDEYAEYRWTRQRFTLLAKFLNATWGWRGSWELFVSFNHIILSDRCYINSDCTYSAATGYSNYALVTKPKMGFYDAFRKLPQIFSIDTWILFALSISAVIGLFRFVRRYERTSTVIIEIILRPILQCSIDIPNWSRSKLFLVFWSYIALVIYVAISSKITQFMVLPSYKWMPDTFEEFANSDYNIYPYFGTREVTWKMFDRNDKVHQKLMKKMFPKNKDYPRLPESEYRYDRNTDRSCLYELPQMSDKNACLYSDADASDLLSSTFVNAIGDSTLLLHTKDKAFTTSFGYKVYDSPPMLENIMIHVQRALQGEIFAHEDHIDSYEQKVKRISKDKRKNRKEFEDLLDAKTPQPLTFDHVNSAFYFLLVFIIVSIAVFIYEFRAKREQGRIIMKVVEATLGKLPKKTKVRKTCW